MKNIKAGISFLFKTRVVYASISDDKFHTHFSHSFHNFVVQRIRFIMGRFGLLRVSSFSTYKNNNYYKVVYIIYSETYAIA